MADKKETKNKKIGSVQEKEMSLEELKAKLKTSETGLSQAEAKHRIEEYGYNEIAEKKASPVLKFLSYFWGPIPWMIEIAIILSAIVRRWPDFFIILALLVINAVVGFWEEFQAGNTIEALKAKLAVQARVKRDGAWKTIPARELVPGDYVRLRIGEIVPADVKLAEGDEIEVDQSALTGESLPVERNTGDICYSGSIIRRGEIEAYVYATNGKTYFGKTAQLVQEAHTVSHFQRAVLKIGDYLIIIAIALVILILAVAIFRGERILTILQFCLILTVAAIPVAMPTVLSVTMAVGARLLAVKQAIVTKLSSIEELAGINILCSDKTGTLTQNKLTLGDPFTVKGTSPEELFLSAALASRIEDQDQIDLTIIGGVKEKKDLDRYKITHFMPFDPVQKRTEASVTGPGGTSFKTTKGAPQVILALAANADEVRQQVEDATAEFASRGFRSLGVAKANGDGKWRFMGVIPMYDPPRVDSRETIKAARDMGIDVKMLTGDQVVIAKEISKELDLGTNIMNASVLEEAKHHEEAQLSEAVENADGFAQVFPEDKFHIVDVLQRRKNIVGMTGDGVNDAPALKKADVGIAVSGSTDAARAAAAIVLLAPGLSVIIDAIKESRKIFQRMTSYAIYRIAETIRVLLFMTLSIIVFNFYPVTAVMIVLLAILNDGSIISIAYDRVRYSNSPEVWDMRIVLGLASMLGVTGVIASFGLFYLGERVFHLDRQMIQSLMYLKLSVAGQLTIYLARTRKRFWSQRPAWILIVATVCAQTIATIVVVFGIFMTPIGWKWAGFVWGYAIAWFLITDQVKILGYRIFGEKHSKLLTKKE
jgi:H+-transporting ATPase